MIDVGQWLLLYFCQLVSRHINSIEFPPNDLLAYEQLSLYLPWGWCLLFEPSLLSCFDNNSSQDYAIIQQSDKKSQTFSLPAVNQIADFFAFAAIESVKREYKNFHIA